MGSSLSALRSSRKLLFQLVVLVIFYFQISAAAVAGGLDLASGSKDMPIEITADNGIEWEKNKEILIASGNAKASRGGITVLAEVLRAYYRKKTTGGTDLYRLDAAGGVKIFSDTESMEGQTAVLDFEQAILKVDGKKVIYKAGPDTITANQQMEYWERQKMAVARGNAVAIHKGKTLRADVLKALLRKNKTGRSEVYIIEAFNNVLIVSDKDRLRSDSAIYKLDSGIVTLKENVSIIRENSILNGDLAEINFKTGISKLLTVDSVGSRKERKRVRGLIYPHRQ
ncbi:MAG: LPS-assembly protein LptD [Alphaproteobacteria bacterium MarineAlpha3_Bin6]|nr:MAG: LPS-assembly protein LptD [Alphaproteobacteria bacterium MarineAlpha3_Bin6]